MKETNGSHLVVLEGGAENEGEAVSISGIPVTPYEDPEKQGVREIVIPNPLERSGYKTCRFCFDRAIAEFSDAVANTKEDFETKISRVLRLGCEHLGLDIGIFTRVQEEQGEVELVEAAEPGEILLSQFKKGARFSLKETFCAQTIRQSDPFAFELTQYPELENQQLKHKSYIGCAIKVDDQLYGTLCFLSRRARGVAFTEEEKALVKLMARNAGNEVERKGVRGALKYRTDFEKLVTSISTEFINLAIEQVDDGIREALRKIAEFAGVDLSYIFLFKEKGTKMDITHWWDADGLLPEFRLKDVSVEKYAWSMKQILNREVAHFPDPDLLPLDAAAERRFITKQEIKSAIVVPMVYSGDCIGLVGFASRRERKNFDEEEIKLLKMVGHILASAVQYKSSQEAVRTLEAQMLHAQKLESLGVLAGGIAHDFNNLLMGVLGNAGLALNQLPIRSSARVPIKRIEKITQHAAELTSKLLSYAGRGKFFVEVLNLSAVVKDMVDLLEAAIPKPHTLKCNFASDLPAVEGDPAQISQVIMNLITNASDAIGDQGGTITLSTGLVAVDRSYLMGTYISDDTPEGVYVYLQVTDTGCGMDEETMSKIFDPFYTTKFTGHGLGLAAVLGIVRGHGGTIKLKSVPGRGTTFTILFPCSDRQEALLDKEPDPTEKWQGNGSILVVDDEESVRSVVAELLKQIGFQVHTAHDGTSALELYRELGEEIDAVILDMTMPDMGGDAVFGELCRIDRNAMVILTSGYSEHEVTEGLESGSFAGFIQKPYRPEVLMQKVFEALKTRDSRALDDATSQET